MNWHASMVVLMILCAVATVSSAAFVAVYERWDLYLKLVLPFAIALILVAGVAF